MTRSQSTDAVTKRVLGNLPRRQTFTRRDQIARTQCPVCRERLLLGRGPCWRCDPAGYDERNDR